MFASFCPVTKWKGKCHGHEADHVYHSLYTVITNGYDLFKDCYSYFDVKKKNLKKSN